MANRKILNEEETNSSLLTSQAIIAEPSAGATPTPPIWYGPNGVQDSTFSAGGYIGDTTWTLPSAYTVIVGGGNADVIFAPVNLPNITYDGGGGYDYLLFLGYASGVNIDQSRAVRIEGIYGSEYNDVLNFNSSSVLNFADGRGGNDVITIGGTTAAVRADGGSTRVNGVETEVNTLNINAGNNGGLPIITLTTNSGTIYGTAVYSQGTSGKIDFNNFQIINAAGTFYADSAGNYNLGGSGTFYFTGGANNIVRGGSGVLDAGTLNLSNYNAANGVTVDNSIGRVIVNGSGLTAFTYTKLANLVGTKAADTFYGTTTEYGVFDGGGGDDTLTFARYTSVQGTGLTVDLATSTHYKNFNTLIGTKYTDTLTADDAGRTLRGGGGGDTLTGGAGNDILVVGNGGANNVDGKGGVNTLSFADIDFVFSGGDRRGVDIVATGATSGMVRFGVNGQDTVNYSNIQNFEGSAYSDSYVGSGGNDTFYGAGGNDVINGGGGNDILGAGGASGGISTVIGGSTLVNGLETEVNTLTFRRAGVGVQIDTLTGIATFKDNSNTVNFSQFQKIDGSDYNDTMIIGGQGRDFTAYKGDDNFVIGGGTLVGTFNIDGGTGSNQITLNSNPGQGFYLTLSGAGSGNIIYDQGSRTANFTNISRVSGSAGDDTVYLNGSLTDIGFSLVGGGGKDTLSFENATSGVSAVFNSILPEYDGLSYIGGFSVIIGSAQSDNFYVDPYGGGGQRYYFHANGGNDYVSAADGDDFFFAGNTGNSTFNGGANYELGLYGGFNTLSFADLILTGDKGIDFTVTLLQSGRVDYNGGSVQFSDVQAFQATNKNDSFDATGSSANWYFDGALGDDNIRGGEGDDVLEGGGGNDTIDGGAGNNTLSFANASSAVTVDLRNVGSSTGELVYGSSKATFSNIQNFLGSAYNDIFVLGDDTRVSGTINGNGGRNSVDLSALTSGASVDLGAQKITYLDNNNELSFRGIQQFIGSKEDDEFRITNGSFTIDGGGGRDRLNFADWSGSNGVTVTLGATNGYTNIYEIKATDRNDVINVLDDLDHRIDVGNGTDVVNLGTGDDVVIAGATGTLTVDGGDGFNVLSLENWSARDVDGVLRGLDIVFTGLNSGRITGSGTVDYFRFTGFQGTNFADTFDGKSSSVNQSFNGGGGNDVITGGSGDNTFEGGGGIDTIDGGVGGFNILSFEHADRGVNINVSATSGTVTYGKDAADVVTYQNIHGFKGSSHDDTFTVDDRLGAIDGGEGDDTLIYRDGNGGVLVDLSTGGFNSIETIIGTSQSDVFILRGDAPSINIRAGDGFDVVSYADFGTGATINLAGDEGFAFEGVEQVTGSNLDDRFLLPIVDIENLNILPFFIDGAGGNDSFSFANYKSGLDIEVFRLLSLGSNVEGVQGSSFNDTFLLSDGIGANVDGGGGDDLISFENFQSKVSITLGRADGVLGYSVTNVTGVIGSKYGDTINGDILNNRIFGGDGNDVINGNAGDDFINAGRGTNTAIGGIGVNTLDFSDAEVGTRIQGNSTSGRVTFGTNDTNYFGFQIINGSIYDDIFVLPTSGNTQLTVMGGSGNDLLSYEAFTKAININLGEGLGSAGNFVDFEGIIGTGLDDTIVGSDGNNFIFGANGNDTIDGGIGDDTLSGGFGVDRVTGGEGYDLIDLRHWRQALVIDTRTGNDGVVQETTNKTDYFSIEGFIGSVFNDVMEGGAGNDTFAGWSGNDVLNGGEGDDILDPGLGVDVVDGGAGNNTLSFAYSPTAVTVDLRNVALTNGELVYGSNKVTFTNIQNFSGSAFNDTFILGDDTKIIGAINGNGGTDRIDLSGLSSGVLIDLDTKKITYRAESATELSYSSIEQITGSKQDDEFYITTGSFTVDGGGGRDRLNFADWAGPDGVTITIGAVNGYTNIYEVKATDRNDVINVLDDIDHRIDAGDGTDIVNLGDGDDLVIAGRTGTLTVNGGRGLNVVSLEKWEAHDVGGELRGLDIVYSDSNSGVITGSGTVNYTEVQGFRGTDFADTFDGTASSADQYFNGGGGNDVISGGSGDNIFEGGGGIDIVHGGVGGINTLSFSDADVDLVIDINGTSGQAGYGTNRVTYDNIHRFEGSKHNDTFNTTSANIRVAGGDGYDTVNFSRSTSSVTLDIADGKITGIEHIIATDGDDTVYLQPAEDGSTIRVEGGLGQNDVVSFERYTKGGVVINLAINSDGGQAFAFNGVEFIAGTDSDDIFNLPGRFTVNKSGAATIDGGAIPAGVTLNGRGGIDYIGFDGFIAPTRPNPRDPANPLPALPPAIEVDSVLTQFSGFEGVAGTSGNDSFLVTQGKSAYIHGLGGTLNSIVFTSFDHGLDITFSNNITIDGATYRLTNISGIGGSNFNDIIRGDALENFILGNNGIDRLYGGDSNDTLAGGAGNDILYGERDGDLVLGNAGSDTLYGDADPDSAAGSASDLGVDYLVGGTGNDTAYGGYGEDYVRGSSGNDTLFGGLGNDRVDGGNGNDWLSGGMGNDLLEGGGRNDLLFGDEGDDTFVDNVGTNQFTGGAGRDTFVLSTPGARNTIMDFDSGPLGDILSIGGLLRTGTDFQPGGDFNAAVHQFFQINQTSGNLEFFIDQAHIAAFFGATSKNQEGYYSVAAFNGTNLNIDDLVNNGQIIYG